MKDTAIVFVVSFFLVFMGWAMWLTCRSALNPEYEAPNAWAIVKQRTNEYFQLNNYGFVTESGSIIAGFTNIQDAIRERDMARNPPKIKPEKSADIFEVVK